MKYQLPRGYLSASAIKTLQTCPKQFEFRYIEGKVIPPNAALAIGSVAHKTLEVYYRDAMSSATRLNPKQAGELSVSTMEDWMGENETVMSSDETNDAKKLLPEIITRYVDDVGQHIRPLDVERQVRFKTSCGVDLLGYLDLVHGVGSEETEEAIADYKVTSKKLNAGDLKNSLQFNLYALMTGISNIQIHNLVKTTGHGTPRKGKEKAEGVTDYATNLRVLEHNFDGSQAEHFDALVEAAARLITAGIFVPCDPTSWACTPNWCGYWKLCRGKGETLYST